MSSLQQQQTFGGNTDITSNQHTGAAWEDAVSGLDESDNDEDSSKEDSSKEKESSEELIELKGEINLRFEIVMKSKQELHECKTRFQNMFRRELESKRTQNERTRLIRREFDITTSLSSSNGRRVFGTSCSSFRHNRVCYTVSIFSPTFERAHCF